MSERKMKLIRSLLGGYQKIISDKKTNTKYEHMKDNYKGFSLKQRNNLVKDVQKLRTVKRLKRI